MPTKYFKFNGKLDRRNPRNEGMENDVFMRENFLARDKRLLRPKGTTGAITTDLGSICTWSGRYHTVEVGQTSPKTFAYTKDGKLWLVNEQAKTATEIKSGLNLNAYPKHQLFKRGSQTYMYLVDGRDLYKYDGNNDNYFEKLPITNADDEPIYPIDVTEHKDRLCLISETDLYISVNIEPDIFDDATDSLDIIVGSGRGKNKSFGKIGDTLFILNTEAKFALVGDVISAVAITFSIDKKGSVHNIISGRTAVNVEGGIMFLADDLNVWLFNGSFSQKISHLEKLEEFINPYRDYLDMAVATYEDNYYKLSFVETGNHKNTVEYWYDVIDTEKRGEIIRGRNVSCYMQTDPAVELPFSLIGISDISTICYVGRGKDFNGNAIRTRLWTKDIPILKNHNVRITAIRPDIEASGDYEMTINYVLDGRQDPTRVGGTQQLEGEYREGSADNDISLIHLNNQNQFTDRFKPRIKYSKGETIAFYIDDSTQYQDLSLKGISIDYVDKGLKKGRKVGA